MSYAAKFLDTETDTESNKNTPKSVTENSVMQEDKDFNGKSESAASLHNGYNTETDGRAFSIVKESAFTEIRVPVPWGHIAGKAWGSSKGHPVLGVHGWMDNAATFDTLAPLLPKSVYFVAIELPGHGFSSHLPPGTNYHYTDFVTSLRRIVKYFKWTKFSWIGHSMGAGLGCLYASLFSNQIERLVMIDLVKPITSDIVGSGNKMANAIESYLSLEEKLTSEPPTYSYENALDRLIKATDEALTEKSAKSLLSRGSRRVSEDQWVFTRDIRLRSPTILRFNHEQFFDVLSGIKCPTMLIKASDAPWFEKKEVCDRAIEIYKQKCSSFQFVEIPGNHFVHLNEPEKLADKIGKFLVEQKSGL